jgi:hypothetical protein
MGWVSDGRRKLKLRVTPMAVNGDGRMMKGDMRIE